MQICNLLLGAFARSYCFSLHNSAWQREKTIEKALLLQAISKYLAQDARTI